MYLSILSHIFVEVSCTISQVENFKEVADLSFLKESFNLQGLSWRWDKSNVGIVFVQIVKCICENFINFFVLFSKVSFNLQGLS